MSGWRQLLGALDRAIPAQLLVPSCSRCGGPPDESGCAVALIDPADVDRIHACTDCGCTLDPEGRPLGARNPDGSIRLSVLVLSKEDQAQLAAQAHIKPDLAYAQT